MMYDVGLVEILSDDLVVLEWMGPTASPRRAMWSNGAIRKPNKCCVTGVPLDVGYMAFRPVGNQDYRSQRISWFVVDAMIKEARK